MAKQKEKLGGIYAIPLPDGTFAFGRLYQDELAIFKGRSTDVNDISPFEIDFYVAVYNDVLTDGEWPLVGMIPFKENEDICPPPRFVDDISGHGYYQFYYKRKSRRATKEECMGLESVSVWDRNHVVDRLMGDSRWTKICK